MNEEMANPGRGKPEENKEVAQAGLGGSSRQTFNFVLGWEHQEPWLFMVPVRWKEGEQGAGGRACP